MKNRVAIVGAGMTLFRRRMLESPKELSFEATRMALDSAGLELKDIQSVVSGSAPDAFDGVHMKGEYLLDGMGGIGKPNQRVYVGGGTGVFTPIGGWWNVASGMYDTCLCVAEEKMSPLHPHPQYAFWSIFDQILERPLGTTLLWIFSLEMRRYMHKYGGGDRKCRSEEQGKRCRSSLRTARRQDNCRRCHELRAHLLAGQTIGRESS